MARLDKHRDHWREVESQIDVGTEIPSVELDELLSIEVDDLLSMELYNIKVILLKRLMFNSIIN